MNGENIQNASTNTYADIYGGNVQPGANIIIFTLNQAGGTRNQDWRVLPVNAGINRFIIQSVLTGGYASVDAGAAGQAIKTSLSPTIWDISVVDTNSRNFFITYPNTNLVWQVPVGAPIRTDITLAAKAGGSSPNQQWKFQALST